MRMQLCEVCSVVTCIAVCYLLCVHACSQEAAGVCVRMQLCAVCSSVIYAAVS